MSDHNPMHPPPCGYRECPHHPQGTDNCNGACPHHGTVRITVDRPTPPGGQP